MKRFFKNLIMIGIIILISFSLFLIINNIKNSNQSIDNKVTNNVNNNSIQDSKSQPGNSDGNSNQPSNSNTPPEIPNSSSENTPPSMPNSSDNQPQKPDSNDTNLNLNNNNTDDNTQDIDNNMTWIYLLFGTLSFIIAILLVYLIMSKFNKKTFKETFINKDKVLIHILSLIIITFSLVCFCIIINNYKQNSSISYSAKKDITTDTTISKGNYSSNTSNENAIRINGDITANISNIKVNKTGDSNSGDDTSFYGINSAILAKGKATLNLKNITIKTSANGANGVFSYGGTATTNNETSDGTKVTISNSKITTTKDNSGGIMTTGGGIMNANNLVINTSGTSSAAIRTDRGGGKVKVKKGVYTTTGQGSPTIYSTADITVSDAKLVAKASEGIVIEGKNSVIINNVTLIDTNNKLNGQSTTYKNIFLYQSMSGDADDGNATFSAKDSKITTNKGDTFYITNTTATINLSNNTIKNNDTSGNFLRSQKDSWGNNGSNGGNVTLNMEKQKALGNIVIDSISTLNMNMKSNSYYEGAINKDNTAKEINLTLDKGSKIKLTGDNYVTSLENEDSSNSNIDFNGYKLYVNGIAI